MLNKVILAGRLTRDPELRHTNNEIAVCKFSIAVNRPYSKDKERQADFIDVTAWRKTAEFVSKHFSKGKAIIVEGRMQNNNYEDKNGVKHYAMIVQADNVNFIGGKSDNQSNDNGGGFTASNNDNVTLEVSDDDYPF